MALFRNLVSPLWLQPLDRVGRVWSEQLSVTTLVFASETSYSLPPVCPRVRIRRTERILTARSGVKESDSKTTVETDDPSARGTPDFFDVAISFTARDTSASQLAAELN